MHKQISTTIFLEEPQHRDKLDGIQSEMATSTPPMHVDQCSNLTGESQLRTASVNQVQLHKQCQKICL